MTGNPHLFQAVPIPASTRRTWATGAVPEVVTVSAVNLQVYDLLDQIEKLQRRTKRQGAVVGLLMKLRALRGGKLDDARLPDGADKLIVLHAVATATKMLALGVVLRIVGISRSRYHVWRRIQMGCGLEDQPSCPKSFPTLERAVGAWSLTTLIWQTGRMRLAAAWPGFGLSRLKN